MAEQGAERYHHGDLHRAARTAAIAIVRAKGSEAVSVREVAARVGVAHRALYRHFADREALLSAVAAFGYDLLGERLEAALAYPPGMQRYAEAFVGFACAEPELYSMMMRRSAAQIDASEVLMEATRRVIAAGLALADGATTAIERRDRVVRIWALAHGVIDLHRNGLIPASDPARLTDYVTALLEL